MLSLHRAHCHHELSSLLHKDCGEKRHGEIMCRLLLGFSSVRGLGCLAGSSQEPCVLLLLKVLSCSMRDITCEAGVGC